MDNAKKLSPMSRARVVSAEVPWLPSAETFAFGTGLTRDVGFAIRGGRVKRNGTGLGKISFPLSARKLSTMLKTANDTSQT